MPQFLDCDSCGAQLKIKAGLAGKKIKCPKCDHLMRMPAPADDVDDDDDDGCYRPAGLKRNADPSRAMKAGISRTQTIIILISIGLTLAAVGIAAYVFIIPQFNPPAQVR